VALALALFGTAKVWFDDLELLVDGKPIADTPDRSESFSNRRFLRTERQARSPDGTPLDIYDPNEIAEPIWSVRALQSAPALILNGQGGPAFPWGRGFAECKHGFPDPQYRVRILRDPNDTDVLQTAERGEADFLLHA